MNNKTENEQWSELYDYVHTEILGYTKDMQLPKFMIYRLRGLKDGKFMSNKNTPPNASYSYYEMLLTFKACKLDIQRYTEQKLAFADEQHRFNYILVIIENNINDIVLKLQNSKQQLERVESIDVSAVKREINTEYKRKSKDIKNSRLDGLW